MIFVVEVVGGRKQAKVGWVEGKVGGGAAPSATQILAYPFSRDSVHIQPSDSSSDKDAQPRLARNDPQFFTPLPQPSSPLQAYRFADKMETIEPLIFILHAQV